MKEEPTRRGFLKRALAGGALAATGIGTSGGNAEAAEQKIEKQAEKIPSAEQIDAMHRQAFSDAEKRGGDIPSNLKDVLHARIFGGDFVAINESMKVSRDNIQGVLGKIMREARDRGSEDVRRLYETEIAKVESVYIEGHRAFDNHYRIYREYVDKLEVAMGIEKLGFIGRSSPTYSKEGANTVVVADRLREALLIWARAGDRLKEMEIQYLK